LIIDNDPIAREQYQILLTHWGYEVHVAVEQGHALLAEARHTAQHYRCHLALVDMRLLDDDDKKDRSGLELIPQLKPTESIMLSSFGDMSAVRQALLEQDARDFIGKEEGPQALREKLDQLAARICRRDLTIDWHPGYEPLDIIHKMHEIDPETPSDEPTCVINRLYPGAFAHITLQPIIEVYRSTDVAPLERSVVLEAHAQDQGGHWHQREIIKLAESARIETEIRHYREYVQPFLLPHRIALIEGTQGPTVVLWDIGAIRYTDVATEDRKPLRFWYLKATSKEVVGTLSDLFDATLGPWYEMRGDQEMGQVYEYYLRHFSKLSERIKQHHGKAHVKIPGLTQPLLDPVVWVSKYARRSSFLSHWQAYTHGDLHADNVYVDQHGRTCIIDYEKSGPGYILRDFVELETDIRLRLLPLKAKELELAYQLDLLLLEPDHPRQLPHWQDIPGASKRAQAELRKAFDAICELRRLAYEQIHFTEMQEYYWAMLMETLFSVLRNYADWTDRSAARLAYQRALLAAALLCERLSHWLAPWPPEHLTIEAKSPTEPERYNVAGIRKLIRAALSAEEFTTLCHDHFSAVYKDFASGMTFDQKITRLLEDCEHRNQLPKLLKHLRAANPEQFARYESQIYTDKPGS
jgi:DNA-binding NarL/FixJ family response regulator